MKKILPILLVLGLVLLVACQPTQPTVEPKTTPEPVVKKETAPEPAPELKEKEMEPPKPFPKLGMKIETVCDVLLPVERFADICGLQADQITLSDKSSERTCWISYTDKNNKRFTAGFTAVDWQNAEEADREFQRGISMRRLEPSTDVGEKNYKYQEIERENIVWQHGRFLTRIGASIQLCTKEQLLKLAQEIDGKLE
ncbi:procyclic acidic repetitive family protein [Candidatus Woesearchaeota archaeon]|nr:procyclic acidic repetitive family protein [Candidatus Woesearchaeota archaeon]